MKFQRLMPGGFVLRTVRSLQCMPSEALAGRQGDVGVLRDEMWYAVELSCTAIVPEWGDQAVQFRQEENGVISTTGVNHFAFRRQDVLHVVY